MIELYCIATKDNFLQGIMTKFYCGTCFQVFSVVFLPHHHHNVSTFADTCLFPRSQMLHPVLRGHALVTCDYVHFTSHAINDSAHNKLMFLATACPSQCFTIIWRPRVPSNNGKGLMVIQRKIEKKKGMRYALGKKKKRSSFDCCLYCVKGLWDLLFGSHD